MMEQNNGIVKRIDERPLKKPDDGSHGKLVLRDVCRPAQGQFQTSVFNAFTHK